MSDRFRAALRRHPGGIAVITAAGVAGPVGFTATSLVSVSADAQLLSFNIARSSSSWPVVSAAEHVGIHLLLAGQRDLAARFARSGADRFAPPTVWTTGPFGVPVLDGCAATIVAASRLRVRAGDHDILVVEAVRFGRPGPAGSPLLYHDGRFCVPDTPENADPPVRPHVRAAPTGALSTCA